MIHYRGPNWSDESTHMPYTVCQYTARFNFIHQGYICSKKEVWAFIYRTVFFIFRTKSAHAIKNISILSIFLVKICWINSCWQTYSAPLYLTIITHQLIKPAVISLSKRNDDTIFTGDFIINLLEIIEIFWPLYYAWGLSIVLDIILPTFIF